MPNINRRGPMGEGPMTGRKLGRCNPDNKGKTDEDILLARANQPTQGLRRGMGNGRGGRGMGRPVEGQDTQAAAPQPLSFYERCCDFFGSNRGRGRGGRCQGNGSGPGRGNGNNRGQGFGRGRN